MKRTWVLVLLLSLVPLSTARAEAPERRWGIGWDGGIGMRYRLSTTWGLGLRVNPNLYNDEVTYDLDNSVTLEDRETVHNGFTIQTMVYRESEIGENLGVGAFLGAGVTVDNSDYDNESAINLSGGTVRLDTSELTSRTTTWFTEFGFRPTYTFKERFVLETRIGIRLEHVDTEDRRKTISYIDGTQTGETFDQGTFRRWRFSAFGQNLGPGAVVQFMIYF